MYRRRNSHAESPESDAEAQQPEAINITEQERNLLGEKGQQVKALISRIADLSHYRAFDDLDFIIEAIGKKDYNGSPALDVLPSNEDIDRDRRERVREYIYCLNSWAEGKDLEDAIAEFKAKDNVLRSIYTLLGGLDEEKRSLASDLAGVLDEKVSSPEDVVSEIPDEEFITYVYNTVLGRDPDNDDLNLRLMELKRGKTRPDLINDILESRESRKRILLEIAESIKQSAGS